MSGPHGFEPIQTPERQPARASAWPIVGIVVLIVAALGIGVWAMLGRGGPAASPSPTAIAGGSPTAIASPTPTATGEETPAVSGTPTAEPASPTSGASPPPPTGSPSSTGPAGATSQPSIDPAVREEIEAIIAQVPELRELEPDGDVPYAFVSREQFQADLEGIVMEDVDPEQLAAEERALKRLGLLSEDADLLDAILDLYGSQVAAFYVPETDRFYIIGERTRLGSFDKLIVAHEYTHALQYQNFPLEEDRITDPSQGDAALAQLAAIEGDATLLMLQWARHNLSPEEILGMADESLNPSDQELLESMPAILRRQLEFPYNDGLLFSSRVYSAEGWAGINDTLTMPPETTEQILHPDKYFADEAEVPVDIPDLADDLGAGWERTYEQTFGELNTQVFVAGGEEPETRVGQLLPIRPHADAAAGWGGDRLAMYEHDDGRWAIAWELAWDTAADADEFIERAQTLQPTLQGESDIVRLGADRVRILLAADRDALAALRAGLGE